MRLEFTCCCGEFIAVERDDDVLAAMTVYDKYVLTHKTSCKEAMVNYRLRGVEDGKEKETVTKEK